MNGFCKAVAGLLASASLASAQAPMAWPTIPGPNGYPIPVVTGAPMAHPGVQPMYYAPQYHPQMQPYYPQMQPYHPQMQQPMMYPAMVPPQQMVPHPQMMPQQVRMPIQTAPKAVPVSRQIDQVPELAPAPKEETLEKPAEEAFKDPPTPQAPATPQTPDVPLAGLDKPGACCGTLSMECFAPVCKPKPRPVRVWTSAEYLHWWLEDMEVPPLVTTGPDLGGFLGVLGQPGTSVLYGGDAVKYGGFNGFRINGGLWLDNDRRWGVEGSIFMLERRRLPFNVASSPDGEPGLAVPFYDAFLDRETSLITAAPGFFSGSIDIQNNSRLWGADVNTLYGLARGEYVSLDVLLGFRFLNLKEELSFRNTATVIGFDNTTTTLDQFKTENNFYGGQIGGRMNVQVSTIYFGLQNKTAMGVVNQLVDNHGETIDIGAGALLPGVTRGGFYVQPSNQGHFSRNRFGIINQTEARVGWAVTPWFTLYGGYDFLYATAIARPGQQIDRFINLTQSQFFGGGVLDGSPRPLGDVRSSTFYAHGINAGFELMY